MEDEFEELRSAKFEGMSEIERVLVGVLYDLRASRSIVDVNIAAGKALQRLGMERDDV